MKIKFQKTREGAIIPKYAHNTDAGMDFFSCEDAILHPGEIKAINTGIIWEPETDKRIYLKLEEKSGLALNYGIGIMGGVIDSSYRGEFRVIMVNHSKTDFTINKGMKIAQGIVYEIPKVKIKEDVVDLNTDRGANGFGSTGK
jgi:dUTP pyrophosphatase